MGRSASELRTSSSEKDSVLGPGTGLNTKNADIHHYFNGAVKITEQY